MSPDAPGKPPAYDGVARVDAIAAGRQGSPAAAGDGARRKTRANTTPAIRRRVPASEALFGSLTAGWEAKLVRLLTRLAR